MPTENTTNRRPYHDTGPIPHESLSSEEKKIILQICSLLMEIHETAAHLSNEEYDRQDSNHKVWATTTRKLNNVILIDGSRGVGKTSLLLTLIDALSKPLDWNKGESKSKYHLPRDIKRAIRVLPSIDFDPLPPELPIYSWIIQAFNPMVRKLVSDESRSFFEDDGFEEEKDSIATLYRKLQQAATIGWTTGLLKGKLGKDAADYLLWQDEQQSNWQRLQKLWHEFVDKLLESSEKTDNRDGYPLPPNSLIVLPIDDLDMQVTRTRELLLALRVLRHNRIIYLLTGDRQNTDLTLTTSFYRDFISGASSWNEYDMNKFIEKSEHLGSSLREKTIPTSQIFEIERIEIRDALKWIPPFHRNPHSENLNRNFQTLLNNLSICSKKERKLGDFLAVACAEDRISAKLTFRQLQGFSDKWSGQKKSSLIGVAEFLKMALEDPLEEELNVNREPRVGSHFGGIIEMTGEFGESAAVSDSIEKIDGHDFRIKWFTQLDFYRKTYRGREIVDPDENEYYSFDPATPNHLLAYDLASEYPNLIEIDPNIKFIGYPLGFIWTEFFHGNISSLVSWPMVTIPMPYSPSKIFDQHRDWVELLEKNRNDRKSTTCELLKSTWYEFNSLNGSDQLDALQKLLHILTSEKVTLKDIQGSVNSFNQRNAASKSQQRLTTVRVFEFNLEDVDYRKLVFRLRSLEKDRPGDV